MAWWELILVILTIGFVSMIEICTISICIGKVLDQRLKTRTVLGRKILKEEMEELKSFIKDCVGMFLPENKKMSEPITYSGYGNAKVVKPIPVKRNEPETLDAEDMDDWLKI